MEAGGKCVVKDEEGVREMRNRKCRDHEKNEELELE